MKSCSFSNLHTAPHSIDVLFFNNKENCRDTGLSYLISSNMAQIKSVLSKVYEEYETRTPKRIKIIDGYLAYILLTGIIEFVYCCLVGTFPFNSFLAGFISTVASFVLAVCLRLQVNPANKVEFAGISMERAFADFIFAHIILHLVVVNFIG